MSRAVFFSILLFSHMFLRIVISSLVGTFEYMLVRSRDANFMFLSYGMALSSFISWAVFSTLNAYGRGMQVFSFLTSILARLYAAAFLQFMIGLIGVPSLCTFINRGV